MERGERYTELKLISFFVFGVLKKHLRSDDLMTSGYNKIENFTISVQYIIN